MKPQFPHWYFLKGAALKASGVHARGAAVDDLVEVFREPIAHLAVAAVLGHALGDAGVELLAVRPGPAVAQGDQGQHLAFDLVRLAAAGLDRKSTRLNS